MRFFVCVFHLNTAYRDIIYMEHGGDKGDMYAQERAKEITRTQTHLPVEEQEKCVARTKRKNYERIKQFSSIILRK